MDSITTAERQRKVFHPKPLDDLKESIAKHSLLHPIVIRRNGRENFLVCGERRLRAMRALHNDNVLFNFDGQCVTPGEIPYIELTDLSDTEYMEAELEENILREDLTWQERSAAIHAIHNIRTERNPEQTIGATARELAAKATPDSPGPKTESGYGLAIHRATVIQRFSNNPAVMSARTENEAYRIARNAAVAPFLQELSHREQEGAKQASPHTLIRGDFATAKLEEGKFSLILADPPYGIGADKFGDAAEQQHAYEDTPGHTLSLCRSIIKRGYQLTAPSGILIIFCDIELFTGLRALAGAEGWNTWRTPLIWNKGSTAHAPMASEGFRREYELMLFCYKGRRPLDALRSDIFDIPTTRDREHAAQKPLALYSELIRITCRPGNPVLDPCCGSGTIFPAAFTTDTRATGIEIEENAYNVAQQRLADVVKNYQRR